MTWVLTWVYYFGLRRENRLRDRGCREGLRDREGEEELADRHVWIPVVGPVWDLYPVFGRDADLVAGF